MNMQGPPACEICGTAKTWVPPGTSRTTGMPYDGFWGCPNRKNHPKGQSAGYPKPFTPPQAAPGRPNSTGMARDLTGRSIEAQAACKAACEAFAGSGLQGMGPDAQHTWIVGLANRLVSEVIVPAVTGQPASAPQGVDDDIPF